METLLPFALFIGISTVVYLVVTKWDRVVSSAQNHWQEQWRKQRQADLQIAPPPVRSEEEEIERLKLRANVVGTIGVLLGIGIVLAVPSGFGFVFGIPVVILTLMIHADISRAAARPTQKEITTKAECDGKIVCPQCQTRGFVTTQKVQVNKGIHGGKATAAVLTGGISMLATGLSRQDEMTQATCSNCGSTWKF